MAAVLSIWKSLKSLFGIARLFQLIPFVCFCNFTNKAVAESFFSWSGTSLGSEESATSQSRGWTQWIPFYSFFTEEPPPIEEKNLVLQWVDLMVDLFQGTLLFLTSCTMFILQSLYSLVILISQSAMAFTTFILSWNISYIILLTIITAITVSVSSIWLYHQKNLNIRLKNALSVATSSGRRRTSSRVGKYYWLFKGLLWVAILAVIISIPWEFIRLYQRQQAKKAAKIYSGLPPECDRDKLTTLQTIKAGFFWYFSWKSHTPCEEYYHAVLVDPLWEVTPVMVLSSLFVRCVLHPLEIVSDSLGRSLKLFFSHIPTQWQPVIMVFLVIIMILCILMTCRYRLRLPFLFVFEPKTPVIQHVKSRRKYITTTSSRKRVTATKDGSQNTNDIRKTQIF